MFTSTFSVQLKPKVVLRWTQELHGSCSVTDICLSQSGERAMSVGYDAGVRVLDLSLKQNKASTGVV